MLGNFDGLIQVKYRFVVAADLVVFVDSPSGVGFSIVGSGNLVLTLFVGGDRGLELRVDAVLTEGLNADPEVGQDKVTAIGAGEVAVGHTLVTDSLQADTRD